MGHRRYSKIASAIVLVVALIASVTQMARPAAASGVVTYSATADIPVPPASAYAGSGGGDGWGLAFTATQVFNVFHHAPTLQLACHEQSDASPCFSPETIVDSSGNGFATSGQPGLYLDRANGELYVYATRTSDDTGGVVCIDTQAAATTPDPFCGFTPLTPAGGAPIVGGISVISNPVLVGSSWYAFNYVDGTAAGSGAENSLLCFDVSAFAACANQPFAVGAGSGTVSARYFPPPAVAGIGSEVIVPITVNGSDELACFDGSAQSTCAGSWPAPVGFGYDSNYGAAFPLLDSSGVVTGLCLPTGWDPCFSLAGASVPTPAGMTAAVANTSPWDGPGLVLGPRVYVPNGNSDQVDCFDYSRGTSCTNFPKSLPNLGLLYTVNPDPQRPSCIWVNSDYGSAQIQNFDAYTGGGCGEGPIRVLASFLVAPGAACVPDSYTSIQVLSPPPSGYTSGTVGFEDSDGNPIPGDTPVALDATGTASLAGQQLNTASGLPQFLITLNGTQGTPSDVKVELTWTGADDPSCTPPSEVGQGGWVPTSLLSTLFGPDSNAGLVNDPVNVAIGNFVDQETDLSYAQSVFGMDWTRTYNSRNSAAGPLGPGWSLGQEPTLAPGSAGSMVLTQGDGRQYVFPAEPGGGWTRPDGLAATLAATTDGWAVTYLAGGETDDFATAGQLLSRADANGDIVSYTYSSGRLSGISSSQGPSFVLNYNPQGQLTSVVTGDGSTVAYSYTASGALSSVSRPGGAVTAYGTDPAGRITTVTDPDGNTVVTNTYDGSGRVVAQTSAGGRVTTFAYNAANGTTAVTDVASGATSTFTYGHDGLVTAATDPTGATTTIGYDNTGDQTSVTARSGATQTETVNSQGLPTSVTDAAGGVTSYTYDSAGRVTSTTDPTGATTSYTYQGSDRIPSTITDPDGHVTTQQVTAGRVLSVVDADGVAQSFTYNSLGQVLTATTAAGTTTNTYDPQGDLLTSTDPTGATTRYTYDPAGQVLTMTDPTGGRTSYTYDADGNQLTVTGPDGGTTTNTYDGSGDLIKTVDPRGQATVYTYDAYGNLVSETGANGVTTPTGTYDALGDQTTSTNPSTGKVSYTFDADGRVTSQTDASGGTTTFKLDAMGRVIQSTDPLGRTTEYTYDGDGRQTSVTDPTGAATTHTYDPAGLLLTTTNADGQKTTYTYTPGGRQATVTDPLGRRTSYTYDAAGREATITSPSGAVTSFGYDADGRTTGIHLPGGLVEKFGYDADGRQISATAPGGEVTKVTYDAASNRTSVTTPTGGTIHYTYDPAGNVLSATDALGATTTYGYDAEGNVVSVTDARGGVQRFTYDPAGHLLTSADQLGRTTSYAYDALGRVASITDPTGRVETRSYDAAGELTTDSWSGPGQPTITDTSTYDGAGRLAAVTGPSGTTSYRYDPAGRLLGVSLPGAKSVSYSYDADGEVGSLTYPDGTTAAYSYTPDGRIASVTSGNSSAAYTYTPAGLLQSTTLPGRTSRSWTYSNGQVTGYSQTVGGRTRTTTVTTDAAGEVTSEQTGPVTTDYRYDAAGQLVSETVPVPLLGNVTVGYAYDANGNRVSASVGPYKATYSYDAANQLTSVASPSLPGAGLTTSFTYDAAGRQVGESNPLGGVATVYDARGQATSRTVTGPQGRAVLAQQFSYDPAGNMTGIASSPAVGQASAETLTWSSGPVPQVLSLSTSGPGGTGSTSDQVYGNQREMAVTGGSASPFAYDANGSTIATPATAPLTQAAGYTAFGAEQLAPVGAVADVIGLLFPQSPRAAGAASFGYRGELQVGGLVDLRARSYDPITGRFTTRDPLPGVAGDVLAANAYPYAANSPLVSSDPTGQHPINQQDFNLSLPGAALPASPAGPGGPAFTQTAQMGSFGGSQLPYACSVFPQTLVPCLPFPSVLSPSGAEALVLGANAPATKLYTPVPPFARGRFIDAYAIAQQRAIEVKTGSQSYSGNIINQVAKDGILRRNMATFNNPPQSLAGGVAWQFYPNLAGTTAPAVPLVRQLLGEGIGVTIFYYDPMAQPQPDPVPVPVPQPVPVPVPAPVPAPVPEPVPSGGGGGGGLGVPSPVIVAGGVAVVAAAGCAAFFEVCAPALGLGALFGL